MNRNQIAVRSLAILVMLVFLRASARKLFGVDETVHHFEQWGYPHWFMLLVASIEVCGAAMLPFFRTMRIGAVLLVPIMLGAIGTQLVHGAPTKAIIPGVVLCALVFLAARKLAASATSHSSEMSTRKENAQCTT